MPGPEATNGFTSIIKNGFSVGKIPHAELHELHRLNLEIMGVTGPFAERLAGWKLEGGLVREIAVKQGVLRTRDTIEKNTPLYRPVIYAMPLTVLPGRQSQSLLMIPTPESFDVRVVIPRLSTDPALDPRTRQDEDEANIRGFATMLTPNDTDTPYVHDGWKIGFGVDVARAFDNNLSRFPVTVLPIVGTDKEQLVAQAQAASRKLKEARLDQVKAFLKTTGLEDSEE
jgi:hypothetical protein